MSMRTFGTPGLTTPNRVRPSVDPTSSNNIGQSSPLNSNSFVINNTVIDLPSTYLSTDFPELVCEALSIDSGLLIGFQHNTCGYIPLTVALKHLDNLPHRGLTTVLKPSEAAPIANGSTNNILGSPIRHTTTPIVMHATPRSPYKVSITSPTREYKPDQVVNVPGVSVPLPRVDMTRATPNRFANSAFTSPYKVPASAIVSDGKKIAWGEDEEDEEDIEQEEVYTNGMNVHQNIMRSAATPTARPNTAIPRSRADLSGKKNINIFLSDEVCESCKNLCFRQFCTNCRNIPTHLTIENTDADTVSEELLYFFKCLSCPNRNITGFHFDADGVYYPSLESLLDSNVSTAVLSNVTFETNAANSEDEEDEEEDEVVEEEHMYMEEDDEVLIPHSVHAIFDGENLANLLDVENNITTLLITPAHNGVNEDIRSLYKYRDFDHDTLTVECVGDSRDCAFVATFYSLSTESHFDNVTFLTCEDSVFESMTFEKQRSIVPTILIFVDGKVEDHFTPDGIFVHVDGDVNALSSYAHQSLEAELCRYVHKKLVATRKQFENTMNGVRDSMAGDDEDNNVDWDQAYEDEIREADDIVSDDLDNERKAADQSRKDTIAGVAEEDDDHPTNFPSQSVGGIDDEEEYDYDEDTLRSMIMEGLGEGESDVANDVFTALLAAMKGGNTATLEEDNVSAEQEEEVEESPVVIAISEVEPINYDVDGHKPRVRSVGGPKKEEDTYGVVANSAADLARKEYIPTPLKIEQMNTPSDDELIVIGKKTNTYNINTIRLSASAADALVQLADRSDSARAALAVFPGLEALVNDLLNCDIIEETHNDRIARIKSEREEKKYGYLRDIAEKEFKAEQLKKDSAIVNINIPTSMIQPEVVFSHAEEEEDLYDDEEFIVESVDELNVTGTKAPMNYLIDEDVVEEVVVDNNAQEEEEEDENELPLTEADREILDMLKRLSEQVQSKLQDVMASQERVQLAHKCIIDAAATVTNWEDVPVPSESLELDQQALVEIVTVSANPNAKPLSSETIARGMRVVGALMQANKDEVEELISNQSRIDDIYRQWDEERRARFVSGNNMTTSEQNQEEEELDEVEEVIEQASAPEEDTVSGAASSNNDNLLVVVAELFTTIISSLVSSGLLDKTTAKDAYNLLKEGNMDVISAVLNFVEQTDENETPEKYSGALEQFIDEINTAVKKH